MSSIATRTPSSDPELLPNYSREAVEGQVEHVYPLTKGGNESLVLFVRSGAEEQSKVPRLYQGQRVSGLVEVVCRSEVLIRSVTITIIGEVLSPSGAIRFLSLRQELFSVERKDGPAHDTTAASRTGPSDLKLKGTHRWPFSMKLPKGVGIPFGGPDAPVTNFDLPASLYDKLSRTTVQYEIVVQAKKGMFSSGLKLRVPLEFVPLIRPGPPSLLRQIAYLEQTGLAGPSNDAEGWNILPPITIRGLLFNTRQVEVTYSIALATPTCYTRGKPLDIWLTITCSDEQALDLLSSPGAQDVRLVQKTSRSVSAYAMNTITPITSGLRELYQEDIAQAQFWSVSSQLEDSEQHATRELQGSMTVPLSTSPGCRILSFEIEYEVAIRHPRAIGFAPSAPSKDVPVLTHQVDIATLPATGTPSSSRPPPEYAAVS